MSLTCGILSKVLYFKPNRAESALVAVDHLGALTFPEGRLNRIRRSPGETRTTHFWTESLGCRRRRLPITTHADTRPIKKTIVSLLERHKGHREQYEVYADSLIPAPVRIRIRLADVIRLTASSIVLYVTNRSRASNLRSVYHVNGGCG